MLSAAFAVLATLLAGVGLYGVLSYTVAQRTREIGLRMAMGATAGSVRASVLRESAVLATIGVGIGLGFSYGGSKLLATGLQGIATLEVSTFVVVALLLSSAVLLASWFPAARATRVDPVDALRSD
jgi:ABC-type antimicrobial peptide transport system permease subunit